MAEFKVDLNDERNPIDQYFDSIFPKGCEKALNAKLKELGYKGAKFCTEVSGMTGWDDKANVTYDQYDIHYDDGHKKANQIFITDTDTIEKFEEVIEEYFSQWFGTVEISHEWLQVYQENLWGGFTVYASDSNIPYKVGALD